MIDAAELAAVPRIPPGETFRLLVTGDRDLDGLADRIRVWTGLRAVLGAAGRFWDTDLPWGLPAGPIVVIEGEARGWDLMCAGWVDWWRAERRADIRTEPYPVDPLAWRISRAAGHHRNQRMVDAGAHAALAGPGERYRRGTGGTWDCVRRARAAGIPVVLG